VGNLILGTFAVHLQEGGFHLQFVPAEENDQSWRRLLLDQRLDGCVAINQVPDFLAQAIADAQLPAVMLNLETKHPFPCILADDHDGARQVTRHLAQLGHRRILFFARASFGGRHFSHRERRNGYYQEMRAAGLAAHAQDVSCTIDELADSLQQPRQPGKGRTRATAVVTSENTEAVELINALWRRGLSVPHDVSVTTFNDIYPMAHLTPPVTTVRVPTDEIGAQGAAMLLRQIGSGQHQGPLRTVIPEVLVPRESSAAPRSSRTRY
jgi:DNA-binding LacI/PurR family transcriptional regulator